MKNIIVLIIIIMSLNIVLASEIKDNTEKSIKNAFGENISLDFIKYKIPGETKKRIQKLAKQAFFRDEVYLWTINKNNTPIGYAILDNVIGKSLPITFLVIFDLEKNIISTEIIKYREQIGGEVKNHNWNSQFIGKNSSSGFLVGDNINGISGATLSVNSVSKGIKKLTYLIDYILETK